MFLIKKSFYSIFLNSIPIVILFFLVFTGFDLSIATVEFVSFNFVYIILFFYILKKPESLGYGLIFFSGIVNDIVLGLPIGISSIDFLILSGIASYFRNLTLRPSLLLAKPEILVPTPLFPCSDSSSVSLRLIIKSDMLSLGMPIPLSVMVNLFL